MMNTNVLCQSKKEVIHMKASINHDVVINKLLKAEALTDEEQKYVTELANKQKKAEDKALEYQARNNLLLAYARQHYEPTDTEIATEVKRIKASRVKA
jgi:hypothetical protein